jgi:hypothetical protein
MRQPLANAALAAALPLLSALAAAAGAPTESVSVPAANEAIENIVVTGQRPEELRRLLLDFIVEIGDPVARNRGYARWRDDLCISVHALADRNAAQYVVDSIALVALEVGLDPGAPGCRPNLHILFTNDGRATATRMVESSPRTFRPWGGEGGTTQGLQALEEFKSAEVPVRWWHVTMLVDEMGLPAIDLSGGMFGPPQIRGTNSRIKNSISDELWGSIIIVDTSKLGEVNWPQLTDYLAMVALAQVKPDGQPAGYASILNLFRDDSPPRGMTEIDRTYLQALYAMDTMVMPHIQRGLFAERMMRELRTAAAAE